MLQGSEKAEMFYLNSLILYVTGLGSLLQNEYLFALMRAYSCRRGW